MLSFLTDPQVTANGVGLGVGRRMGFWNYKCKRCLTTVNKRGKSPTWEQSSITSSTTEVLDFMHTRPAEQTHTAQSAPPAFCLRLHIAARYQNTIKISCCTVSRSCSEAIRIRFIKSMLQRRQEQTVERKGARRRQGTWEQERSTLRRWRTKIRDISKQVGRGRYASLFQCYLQYFQV